MAAFLEASKDGKVHAKCKTCGNIQAPKPARMINHYDKCNNRNDPSDAPKHMAIKHPDIASSGLEFSP